MSDAQVTFIDPHAPALGSTVGPWLLLERLDSGSYGVVFPSVPRYEDSGVWTSSKGYRYPYVVMECVEGFTLYDWFLEQQRSTREVLRVLAQVARGMAAVHARGAVHRDVKGDNIRVTPKGRAVLVDFGSGWLPGARPLTDTAAPPGTTPYRAPELLRFMWRFRMDTEAPWQASPSDDLYSLGVTAYRLVTGIYLPPVTETEDAEPRKLLRPRELATVALELEVIILRLLSEDPKARGTAAEIAEAMERAVGQAGPEADRPILPTRAAVPTEEGAPRFSSRSSSSNQPSSSRPSTEPERRAVRVVVPAWLSSPIAAVVGGLLVAFAVELLWPRYPEPKPWIASPEEWHAPPLETPDAGVAEEALLTVEDFPRVGVHVAAFAAPLPKKPSPGQRKPPCHPTGEIEALGACWAVLGHKPPCNGFGYEYEGRCVIASFDSPGQPASEQP